MKATDDCMQNVSRETSDRLQAYAALVRKWNPAINLVAPSTLDELETRHFADSMQLYPLAPASWHHWVDLGSGGGFPGMIVAIQAADIGESRRVTLIESDRRKAAFLSTVVRELDLTQTAILPRRIESAPPQGADVLSARALAPLSQLIGYARRHLRPDGIALFPKGARYREELDAALASTAVDVQDIPSKTDPQAVILKLGGIARV